MNVMREQIFAINQLGSKAFSRAAILFSLPVSHSNKYTGNGMASSAITGEQARVSF